jgi:hypothetical protein
VGRNLWEEARTDVTVVLLSPEELKSREFGHLLDLIYSCIFALGVDEVHLLYFWAIFRPRFRQIGASNFCAMLSLGARFLYPSISRSFVSLSSLFCSCSISTVRASIHNGLSASGAGLSKDGKVWSSMHLFCAME